MSVLYWLNYRIIGNLVAEIFSLFAKVYMTISTTMASKPYVKPLLSKVSKHWYWKSSCRNSSYQVSVTHHIEILILKISKLQTILNLKFQIPYRTSTSIGYHNLNGSLLCMDLQKSTLWRVVDWGGWSWHICHSQHCPQLMLMSRNSK